MKVIERYILRRTLTVFAATLFWTLAIVWTTQVLARINLVTDSGQSALTFFEVATLILPSVIPVVVPFALVIGVAQTLSMMNADSELVIISAAGSPRTAVIRPIVRLAIAACVFCFVVDNGIDPYARQRSREIIAEANADLLSTLIEEGTFRKIDDGLFIQIGQRLPDGRLGEVFLADSRQKDVDFAYYAKNGVVTELAGSKILIMSDGTIHRKTPGGEVSIIKFTSYAFDLSQFVSAAQQITLFPKDRTLGYILAPPTSDPLFQRRPQLYAAEVHRRLTEWIYPLIFALIALAVAGDARSHRESRIHPLLTAVTIALAVRWAGFFVTNQAQNVAWFGYLAYAVPAAAAAVSIGFIVAGRTMELPVAWVDRLLTFTRALSERLLLMRFRLGRRPAVARGPA